MKKITLQIDGLDELREQLRRLPGDLAQEAGDIIATISAQAAQDIRTAYPEGPTGNLRLQVTREMNRSKFGVSAIVKSNAKHAWIFNFGTKPRYTTGKTTERNTRLGRAQSWRKPPPIGTYRGVMHSKSGVGGKPPESQRFVPIAQRHRAEMYRRLMAVIERSGGRVTRA